jgi:hypothetical protein
LVGPKVVLPDLVLAVLHARDDRGERAVLHVPAYAEHLGHSVAQVHVQAGVLAVNLAGVRQAHGTRVDRGAQEQLAARPHAGGELGVELRVFRDPGDDVLGRDGG